MSVYTELTLQELQKFTNQFDLGHLKAFKGVEAGVENTTYFVSLTNQETVLQIFEEQGFEEIPFFVELNRRLGYDGVPVATPIANINGERLFTLKQKPAVLYPRLKGSPLTSPNPHACNQIGRMLGRMHIASIQYKDLKRENHRWNLWWESNVSRVLNLVQDNYQQLLIDQITRSKPFINMAKKLPNGIIHGDLFVDNVLFDGDTLAGIIDFYNACNGAFIFDLAIAVNDWCSGPDGRLINDSTKSLVAGYQEERALTDDELSIWALALETAALRFWMLRLVALARKREGGPKAPPHVKDPNDFLAILSARRSDPQCDLISN
jgi:homoserine kinase type II